MLIFFYLFSMACTLHTIIACKDAFRRATALVAATGLSVFALLPEGNEFRLLGVGIVIAAILLDITHRSLDRR